MVVTSIFIPYEVYDLYSKVTALRLVAFAINVALVLYLVLTKRLFGVRGGKKAYDARLRGASIILGGRQIEQPGPPPAARRGRRRPRAARASQAERATQARERAAQARERAAQRGSGRPGGCSAGRHGASPGPVRPGRSAGVPRR